MDNYKEQKRNYKHLDVELRETIAIKLALKVSVQEIAAALDCHRSTERIKRNTPKIRKVEYRANRSQMLGDQRKEDSHNCLRLKTEDIWQYVRELELKWSPERSQTS